jgi:hypothetical protein
VATAHTVHFSRNQHRAGGAECQSHCASLRPTSCWMPPTKRAECSPATSRSLRLAIQAGAGIHFDVIANLDAAEMSVRLVCSLNHSKIRVEL